MLRVSEISRKRQCLDRNDNRYQRPGDCLLDRWKPRLNSFVPEVSKNRVLMEPTQNFNN